MMIQFQRQRYGETRLNSAGRLKYSRNFGNLLGTEVDLVTLFYNSKPKQLIVNGRTQFDSQTIKLVGY